VPERADVVLEAVDLTCHFDVSPPLLTRVLERKPKRILKAVDGVSFRVRRGSTFSIVGESGCGKSTLAKIAVGLQRPTAGTIALGTVPGRDGRHRTPRLQMIFQDPYASLNPRWRVEDIVAEPLHELGLVTGAAAISARVREILGLVGLAASDARRYPHEFSGGQRQRISIARALATEADLLVCDEPTSALDVSVQSQILNLLQALQAELGLTYLLISHNMAVVEHVASRVVVMYLGRIVEQAESSRLFGRPAHPYTRALMQSVLTPEPGLGIPDTHLGAAYPDPTDKPAGCSFHPRCADCMPVCRSEAPPLADVDGTRVACHLYGDARRAAAQ